MFNVDDELPREEKVLLIPIEIRAESIGTWTLCGCWSKSRLKDGYVPDVVVESEGGTLRGAKELVRVKLWKRARGGYQFLNWEKWQETREQVEERRRKEAERKAAWRARKDAESILNVPPVSHGTPTSVPEVSPLPLPDLTQTSSSSSSSSSSSTHLGIEGGGSLRDPRKCGPHQNVDDPGPCGACADARRRHETQEAQKAKDQDTRREAERQRRLACPYCNDDGWRDTINGTVIRCTHEPEPHKDASQDDRIDT